MIQESKKNGVARAEGQMDLRCITCFIAILFYADRASVSSKSSFNFSNIQDVISPSLNYDRAKFFRWLYLLLSRFMQYGASFVCCRRCFTVV